MTQIDFYLLAGPDPLPVLATLCDKAVASGAATYVMLEATNDDAAARFSDLLWTQRQGSFLAHEYWQPASPPAAPLPSILLGHDEPPASHHDLLIHIGTRVPAWHARFTRLIEVVPADPALRGPLRERYKHYRDRGYPLRTFQQTPSGGWKRMEQAVARNKTEASVDDSAPADGDSPPT